MKTFKNTLVKMAFAVFFIWLEKTFADEAETWACAAMFAEAKNTAKATFTSVFLKVFMVLKLFWVRHFSYLTIQSSEEF